MARLLPLIVLLMIPGVCCQIGWGVTYSSSHICALKDSTVKINCTYKYPTGYKITEVFWTNTERSDPPDLSKDSKYSERIQYLGDKQHDCSVRLTDVRHTDSHEYYFRFITDKPDGKWTGAPGVTLDVTDLQVESEGERVMEGHSVTLTCKSRCSLTDTSTFIWFRNTQTLNDTNKKLILPSVRRENAGDYSCAVQGHKLTSPPRRLNVIYPPDDPVISISSSGVIVEGDSVTLTCSSESNPPVHIYSWFKENQTSSVGSGQTFSISNFNSSLSGWFYCVAQNEVGSQRSAAVSVTVHHSSDGHLLFGIASACGGLLVIAVITVLIWFMMRKRRVAKTEDAALNQVNQQDDLYCAVKHVDLASESAHCGDVQYESVKPQRIRGEQTTAGEAPESKDPEELQYATVHHHDEKMRRSEENENHYGNITNFKLDASVRSNAEDISVIYSSVK